MPRDTSGSVVYVKLYGAQEAKNLAIELIKEICEGADDRGFGGGSRGGGGGGGFGRSRDDGYGGGRGGFGGGRQQQDYGNGEVTTVDVACGDIGRIIGRNKKRVKFEVKIILIILITR